MKHLGLAILLISLSACSSWFPIESDRDDKTVEAPLAEVPPPQDITPVDESKPLTDNIASPMMETPETVDVSVNKHSYIDQKHGEDESEKSETSETPDEGTIVVKKSNRMPGVAAEKALGWLKNGNKRFLKPALRVDGQSKKDIKRLADAEKPHSFILTTSDSRVSPEIIFDQKLGEISVARNLSLAVDSSVVNSLDYAIGELGVKLILVLDRSNDKSTDFSHADQVAQKLVDRSSLLNDELAAGSVKVISAVYDIHSGKVIFGK